MVKLSVEKKAALLAGATYWRTLALPGVPPVTTADGPHGVRRTTIVGQDVGLAESVPATCFPPASGMASTWNRELVERIGRAIGDECRAQGVNVLLGPGINIKRSPLGGRNFEYLSEDPAISGELGAALVHGLQSRGVGASVKHFAVNNQETNRMTVNVEIDERALRELYLPAFETIITREQPWTIMTSYNRINGVYAVQNEWLLTQVLREEWEFAGVVISDWNAVDDRVAALRAGCDLQMPGPAPDSEAALIAAARTNTHDAVLLDSSVARLSALASLTSQNVGPAFDEIAHHALAREAATEAIVMLKNDDVLPLAAGKPIAVIGEFARTPRYQGAGSSQVNPTSVDAALDALAHLAPVEFAAAYTHDGADDELHAEAVALAERAETVLLFVGLTQADEPEGYDRTHIDLAAHQLDLIRDVTAANPRVVVILTNGGVVSLEPWHDSAAAILETWLLGQAGGGAIADVVFGVVSPSGRLAESIPLRLEDNPSFLNFPGDLTSVRYGEGVFVGYRYYESAKVAVRYPFGHGLSYTSFEYSELSVDGSGQTVTVRVTNTGTMAGKEVVQLYIAPPTSDVRRPVRELRAFTKVSLEPGESSVVRFGLTGRAYSYWDVENETWEIANGNYQVQIARSAHDVALETTVTPLESRPAEKRSIFDRYRPA